MSNEAGPAPPGALFVVSAPSGAGKTTLVDALVAACPGVERSRSFTSRPPRAGEADGVDYNFISRQAFEAMAAAGEFLEWADVFGNLYGTGRRATDARLAAGVDLVLVIDVQGARQVRAARPEAVAVFVLPPAFDDLGDRLRGRNQDDEAVIARRLQTARDEVAAVSGYDYVVINDERDRAVEELAAIVRAERARMPRRRAAVARVLETFR